MRRSTRSRSVSMILVVLLLAVQVGVASADDIMPTGANRPPVAQDDPVFMNSITRVVSLDSTDNEQLGTSVAISGDTAVIGAPYKTGGGAAYVFEKSEEGWIEVAKLMSSDPANNEGFGCSVAIEGDTIVVGEWYDAGGGAAHVFTRAGAVWSHSAKLVASVRGTDDKFGCDVAISGDTIVVGAIGYASQEGGVYVFRGAGDTWAQEGNVLVGPASVFWFGASVDVDADSLIAGSYYDNSSAYDAGAAYVFTRTDTTWSLQQKLLPGDPAATDYFGKDVALCGDVALVGAPQVDDAGNNTGCCYVFDRTAGVWSETDKLASSESTPYANFGYSVSFDGHNAVVGAKGAGALTESGRAYAFQKLGPGAWVDTSVAFGALAPDTNARFGWSVAIDGGVALVGACGEDGEGNQRGAAYFAESYYRVAQDTMLTVDAPGVLANDYDPDGDAIQVNGSYGALHGYVMQTTLGNFEYTPDAGFTGYDSFQYKTWDGMDYSATATVSILVEGWHEYVPIQGDNRYATAAEAARTAFSAKGADTAVIATGRNFPDALGGSALAGALEAPLLLVETASVPAEVIDVIQDLGITNAVILGGTGAVAPGVEAQLIAAMGASSEVTRVAGANRYDTARKVAAEVVDTLGVEYENVAFVATGANFPDALAAGPLAAGQGWPIYLAENGAGDAATIDAMEAAGVTDIHVLGGTGVVKPAMYSALESAFGAANVDRLAGDNRYETAAEVVLMGINDVGARWSGAGLATGTNFPDALAAGAALGYLDTVLLLSDTTALSPATEEVLSDNRAYITEIHYFGGLGALSQTVRDRVRQVVEAP